MLHLSVSIYAQCDNGSDYPAVGQHHANTTTMGDSYHKAVQRLSKQGWWFDMETGRALCPKCNEKEE